MKRILSIVMGCVILLSLISLTMPVNALSNEVDTNVLFIPLHSNEINDKDLTVYEIDGFYYMTIGQIARLTNLEIKLSGKEHVGGELHIYDFDDKFDLIGEGYSLLTFVDGIREVTIDLPNGIIREGNNRYNVKLAVYDNHYIIEAVPILKYLLGKDSCYFENGVFNCITPQETVWSVLGDAFEDANTYCYNYTYFFDDYEKRLTIEIAYQCFMDLRIPKIKEYYRKAIHDILSDNIYTYSGVQELSSKQEQEMTSFISSDDILDITDVSKDVINTSASRITEYTINHQLQTLNKDWLKASNLRESSELSKQINIKTNELIDSKNYYNKTETALKAVMYGANIANAFAKNCAYENDTASLLDSAISPEILSNVDTNSWYWLGEANRINSSIKSKWSNLGNSILDSTVRLFEDEGNDKIVSSIGEGAASYFLILKAELLVGKLIYKDTYEMVDRDIMSAFESDMQSAYKSLSHALFVKARNEMYESIDTIEQMLAAYKFYYKLSAIYLKNLSSQYNEATWMGNYADAAAVMYYRLLTCYKTPNSGFDNLKDDVFSASSFIGNVSVVSDEVFYEYIQNVLIPQYGLASTETEIPIQNAVGIVSAHIIDSNEDKKMVVVRLEYENNGAIPIFMLYTLSPDSSVSLVDEEKCPYSWNNITIHNDENIYVSGQTIPKVFGVNGWTVYELIYSLTESNIELKSNESGRGADCPQPQFNESTPMLMELATAQFTEFVETDTFVIHDYTDLRSHLKDDNNIEGAENSESHISSLEMEPNIHYFGTELVNGVTLKYDLYLLPNKTMISVTTPTETGGSISFFFENIEYANGIYSYSNGVESEMVPGAMRSLVAASDLSGTIKVIDAETIEWTNTANSVGRSFTVTLKKE